MLCSIAGCDRKHCARGLCKLHYYRKRNTGDVGSAMPGRASPGKGTTGYVFGGFRGKREHVAIAEAALGRPLPPGVEVHHVNENPRDNRPSNLVICPDRAYHALLHQRQRALDACGHADWRKCCYCGCYDDPANMVIFPSARSYRHRECAREYVREQGRRAHVAHR